MALTPQELTALQQDRVKADATLTAEQYEKTTTYTELPITNKDSVRIGLNTRYANVTTAIQGEATYDVTMTFRGENAVYKFDDLERYLTDKLQPMTKITGSGVESDRARSEAAAEGFTLRERTKTVNGKEVITGLEIGLPAGYSPRGANNRFVELDEQVKAAIDGITAQDLKYTPRITPGAPSSADLFSSASQRNLPEDTTIIETPYGTPLIAQGFYARIDTAHASRASYYGSDATIQVELNVGGVALNPDKVAEAAKALTVKLQNVQDSQLYVDTPFKVTAKGSNLVVEMPAWQPGADSNTYDALYKGALDKISSLSRVDMGLNEKNRDEKSGFVDMVKSRQGSAPSGP